MPDINARGDVLLGVGGAVSVVVGGHVRILMERGTCAQFLTDDLIIANCADVGWRVATVPITGGPATPVDQRGCNFLTAKGGRWQAYLVGVACFGSLGDQAASLGLIGNDGRGAATDDGTIAICPQAWAGQGFELHDADGSVVSRPGGIQRDLQVIWHGQAIWRDDAGRIGTLGIAPPVQLPTAYRPRCVEVPFQTSWLVYWNNVVGIVAHPWDSFIGAQLTRPGQDAFYHDARIVNGKLKVVWSRGAGELPGEAEGVDDAFTLPRVDLRTLLTPEPPHPPNPPDPPEPPQPPEPPIMPPPPDNGIVNGVVVNPKHYFFSLVWDKDPRTYRQVFSNIRDALWRYGMGFQTRTPGPGQELGEPTSRLYLPTPICPNAAPKTAAEKPFGVKQDQNCWDLGRMADTVENDPNGNPIAWTWVERGPQPYQPMEADTPAPPDPPDPPEPPPTGELKQRVMLLESAVRVLRSDVDVHEMALQSMRTAVQEAAGRAAAVDEKLETHLTNHPGSGVAFDPTKYEVKTPLSFRSPLTGQIVKKP